MSRTYHHGDKAKQKRFGSHWRWYSATPSWWNRLFHHKPARRAVRDRLRNEDWENLPDHRKPHKYYW